MQLTIGESLFRKQTACGIDARQSVLLTHPVACFLDQIALFIPGAGHAMQHALLIRGLHGGLFARLEAGHLPMGQSIKQIGAADQMPGLISLLIYNDRYRSCGWRGIGHGHFN